MNSDGRQWRIQDLPKGGGDHGEREPKRGSGGRAPGGGSGGQSPPEAESFLYIFTQKSGQKLRI